MYARMCDIFIPVYRVADSRPQPESPPAIHGLTGENIVFQTIFVVVSTIRLIK